MTTASIVSIRKALGKPAPAILVDEDGHQVLSASQPNSTNWYFATEIDSHRFFVLTLFKEAVTVGLAIVPSADAVPVLVVAHQVGNWEHRLLVPLVGNTVRHYLESLLRAEVGIKVSFGDENTNVCIEFITKACAEQLKLALAHWVKHSYRTEHVGSDLDVLGAQYKMPEQFPHHPMHGKVKHVQVSAVTIPELQIRL